MTATKRLEAILDSQEIKNLWESVKNAYLKAKEDFLKIIEGIDVSKLEDLWKKDVIERNKGVLLKNFSLVKNSYPEEMGNFLLDREKKLNESYRSTVFLFNLIDECERNKVKIDENSIMISAITIGKFWATIEKIDKVIFDNQLFPNDSQKQEKIIEILKEASSR